MTLPDLALQIVYGHIGWAVVAAAVAAAIASGLNASVAVALKRQANPLSRRTLAALMVAALVAMALPGEASPAYWLGLAFQYPSGLLAACCLLRLHERWHGIRRSSAMPHALAGMLVVCGTLLYLDTFGLLTRGFYYAGFGATLAPVAAVLGALACVVALVRGQGRGVAAPLLGAIALFSLLRLPSGNLWDALLDPLLCGWAVAALVAAAFRRNGRRASDRLSDRISDRAPVKLPGYDPDAPLVPSLQPAPREQFSSMKE